MLSCLIPYSLLPRKTTLFPLTATLFPLAVVLFLPRVILLPLDATSMCSIPSLDTGHAYSDTNLEALLDDALLASMIQNFDVCPGTPVGPISSAAQMRDPSICSPPMVDTPMTASASHSDIAETPATTDDAELADLDWVSLIISSRPPRVFTLPSSQDMVFLSDRLVYPRATTATPRSSSAPPMTPRPSSTYHAGRMSATLPFAAGTQVPARHSSLVPTTESSGRRTRRSSTPNNIKASRLRARHSAAILSSRVFSTASSLEFKLRSPPLISSSAPPTPINLVTSDPPTPNALAAVGPSTPQSAYGSSVVSSPVSMVSSPAWMDMSWSDVAAVLDNIQCETVAV